MKHAKRLTGRKATYILFILPPLILYTFFYIVSVAMGLFYSFTNWNGLKINYDIVGIRNYVQLTKNIFFWRALERTLYYSVLLVVAVTVISLVISLTLNSTSKFQVLAKSIFFFPAMLGSIVVALIWSQMFYQLLPKIGEILHMNLKTPLGSSSTALYGVLFVNVWQAVAIPTIILLAGLQSIPEDLYESAMIDGASKFQKFRFITVPFMIAPLTINMILTFKGGITSFDYAYALTDGGPNRATEFISLMIYNDGFKDSNFAMANAKSVVLFFIIAILSLVQVWNSNRQQI